MPRLRLGDAVLAYDAAGAGAPIVFLHGVGSSRRTWAGQLAEFGRDHLAVAVDMRGYSESEADPSTVSLRTFALDVAALIDHLDAGAAHVCGLSMGGLVALHLWRERRDAVRSLILCDTFASHPVAAAGHPQRMAAIEESTMPELARARMPAVYAPTTEKAVVERGVAVFAKLDKNVYRAASDEVWLQKLEDVARTVTVPTLVPYGGNSRSASAAPRPTRPGCHPAGCSNSSSCWSAASSSGFDLGAISPSRIWSSVTSFRLPSGPTPLRDSGVVIGSCGSGSIASGQLRGGTY